MSYIGARVSDECKKEIQEEAERLGVSIADIIRHSLYLYMEMQKGGI